MTAIHSRESTGRLVSLYGAGIATLLAHLSIRAGQEAEFETIAARVHEASHRLEPTLLRYEYYRSATAGRYYCLLSFEDEASFLRHQVSDHHEAETGRLRDLIEHATFEWIDPMQDASPLPRTEATGRGDQDSPAALAYHRAMGVAVAEWWEPLRD